MNMRPHKATKLKRRKEPTAPRRRSSSVANLPGQLDSRTRELAEAREQQAATSEILRGISSSPTDVRPVFDTIVRSAVRLCDGVIGALNTFDGELMHVAAVHNYTPEALAAVQRMYPMRPSRQQLTGRAILSRTIVHVPDVLSDPEYAPDIALAGGWRSGLAVPMIRNEAVIGVILVMRAQVGPFSHEQIELLKTFADQAAIAIENVRLFEAEQQRTWELTESLEYRTATGDILRVISSSPTDVQPVFNTIAESGEAVRRPVLLRAAVRRRPNPLRWLPWAERRRTRNFSAAASATSGRGHGQRPCDIAPRRRPNPGCPGGPRLWDPESSRGGDLSKHCGGAAVA